MDACIAYMCSLYLMQSGLPTSPHIHFTEHLSLLVRTLVSMNLLVSPSLSPGYLKEPILCPYMAIEDCIPLLPEKNEYTSEQTHSEETPLLDEEACPEEYLSHEMYSEEYISCHKEACLEEKYEDFPLIRRRSSVTSDYFSIIDGDSPRPSISESLTTLPITTELDHIQEVAGVGEGAGQVDHHIQQHKSLPLQRRWSQDLDVLFRRRYNWTREDLFPPRVFPTIMQWCACVCMCVCMCMCVYMYLLPVYT